MSGWRETARRERGERKNDQPGRHTHRLRGKKTCRQAYILTGRQAYIRTYIFANEGTSSHAGKH